jgi:hypothetical protein
LKFGIEFSNKKESIDNNPPIIRIENDLNDFLKSSFKILSIKVIKNIMKKDASVKLRVCNRFKEAKYKGQVIKLRYDINISKNLIFSLLEATKLQKANNFVR